MRLLVTILLLFGSFNGFAQNGKLVERMKQFHQSMIDRPDGISSYIHSSLSYGHSNGWIENATEFKEHLGSYIVYHSIKEDSITTADAENEVVIRFAATIDVTMNGVRSQFKLKVLEVWVKKRKDWVLLARQAVKG